MYGYLPAGFGGSVTMAAALLFIALIASIVITVMGYNRYVRVPNAPKLINPGDRSTWAPFLRFDTLLIERILKVLYLFLAVFQALSTLAIVIAAVSGGFAAFIGALVMGIVGLFFGEVVLRLAFEAIMLNVVIARNTSDIKRAMGIGDPMDADGIASPAPSAAEYAAGFDPYAQAQTYQQAGAPQGAPGQAAVMPAADGTAGLCPSCGAPLSPDAAFCGTCGTRLR